MAPSSAQYVWLERHLAQVDRKKTPWLVVTAHRGFYPLDVAAETDGKFQIYQKDVSDQIRRAIEPLMFKHQVCEIITVID